MTIEERLRAIMLDEELSNTGKRDQPPRPHPCRRVQDRRLEQGDTRAAHAIESRFGSRPSIAATQRESIRKETRKAAVSGAAQPSFERLDILKPMLNHLEANDAIVLHGLQQKVLSDLIVKGRPVMSSAAAQLVFQALRDALTGRAEEILSMIRKVFDDAYIEDFENLTDGLKKEVLNRLERFRDLASAELGRTTQSIRSNIALG
jgi:hypothetical protein